MEEKIHVLKIKTQYYKKVVLGQKTFELRKNDRNFQVGDLIRFIEVKNDSSLKEHKNLYKITYVLKDCPQYGLQEGCAILSIVKEKRV